MSQKSQMGSSKLARGVLMVPVVSSEVNWWVCGPQHTDKTGWGGGRVGWGLSRDRRRMCEIVRVWVRV